MILIWASTHVSCGQNSNLVHQTITHKHCTQYGDSSISSVITIAIDNELLQMEIDTGTCVSIGNHKVYKKLCAKKLKPSQTKLRGYAGHSIKVMGEAEVNVCHNGQQATLSRPQTLGDYRLLCHLWW